MRSILQTIHEKAGVRDVVVLDAGGELVDAILRDEDGDPTLMAALAGVISEQLHLVGHSLSSDRRDPLVVRGTSGDVLLVPMERYTVMVVGDAGFHAHMLDIVRDQCVLIDAYLKV
jgi:predicted regulator of Ras-like GTPase activity (Roadblock/LC7/MglB family)